MINLPASIVEGEKMARRLIELGYNAVIFASQYHKNETPSRLSWDEASSFLMSIRVAGIKVGLQCSIQEYEEVKNFFDFDFFFCESREKSFFEEVRKEIHFLEAHCKKPLIYFLSCRDAYQAKRQSKWMIDLAHEVAPETILAYPALCGTAFSPHPIFDELSKNLVSSSIRFLPMFYKNGGSLLTVSLDLYEDVLAKQIENCLFGLGICIGTLPKKGSFPDLILWIIGKRLWKYTPIRSYVAMWLQLHHKEAEQMPASASLVSLFHLQGKIGELESCPLDQLKKKMHIVFLQIEEIESALRYFSRCEESFQKELVQHSVDLKKQFEEIQYRRNKAG